MKSRFLPLALVLLGTSSAFTQTGVLQWNAWNNLSGTNVENLTQASKFLNTPETRFNVNSAASPIDSADNFGGQLRGTITAPVTGVYTFWIASDDSSELWLGTTISRFSKRLIAEVNGWTPVQSWNVYGTQQSASINLIAGQKYWVEALVKEGGGGDHVEIAWQYTGQSRQIIPSQYIEWPGADSADSDDDGLPDTWQASFAVVGAYADPDHDGFINIEEYQNSTSPLETNLTGVIEWNIWTGIGGDAVSNLTQNSKFQNAPDELGFVNSAASPVNYSDGFGTRLRGTITAPVTGNYSFWIASDDQSELWLGTTASRFSKRLIATVNSATGVQSWDGQTNQRSAVLVLQAGQKYWIEALAKDGGGGDHVEIAWEYVGQSRQLIPGSALNPPGIDAADRNDDGLPDAWATNYGVQGAFNDADGDGISNLNEYIAGTHPNQQGSLERAVWTGIGGVTISDLTNHAKFLQPPDAVTFINGSACPVDTGSDFGQRLRGTITAPVSGNYSFWFSSDDNGQLWLGTTASRFSKRLIARVDNWTASQQWDNYPSQHSVSIALVAGQKYWIEGLAKEAGGGDNLGIAWDYPGQGRQLIPNLYLEPPAPESNDVNDDGLPDNWQAAYGIQNAFKDTDLDGVINLTEYQNGTNPVGGVAGCLSRDVWLGVGGESVASLVTNNKFLGMPDVSELWSGGTIFSNANSTDNFGQRFRGTIKVPVTGQYRFWIASDNQSELWLSTNDRKFNKQKIAFLAAGGIPEVGASIYVGNGGFEAPTMSYGGWNYWSGDMAGWNVNGGGVAYNGSPWFGPNAPEGNQALFLQAGNVTREISVSDSGTYEILFQAVGRGGEYGPAGVIVKIDGTTYLTVTGGQMSQTAWQNYTIPNVNLAAGNHTLEFVHNNTLGGDKAVAIDNLRMNFTGAWNSSGTGRVYPNDFDHYATQKSALVTLQANQEYYIEILHKEGTGEEHVEVVWQKPAGVRETIPTVQLTSFSRDPDDLDDDDLPDSWETTHTLAKTDNGSVNFDNGALGDPDHDALTNRQEWLLGTNPKNADTDGDGGLDGDEQNIFHTNPLTNDVDFNSVTLSTGQQATVQSGEWASYNQNGAITNVSVRGGVNFAFTLPGSGLYAVKLTFDATESPFRGTHKFDISVDGILVGRIERSLMPNETAVAMLLLPWLPQGTHTVRVFYDNHSFSQFVTIRSLELLEVEGTDANANGVADWAEALIAEDNHLTGNAATSLTSPVCIEGNGRFEWMSVATSETVNPAPNGGWYINADLPESGTLATKTFTFENGALQASRTVSWSACNLLTQSNLVIRKGDALRLTGFPGTSPDGSSVNLFLNGQSLASTTANNPYVCRFNQAGSFQVRAVHQPSGGSATERTITVDVKEAAFNGNPVIIVNQFRDWENPNISSSLDVEFDTDVPVTASPLSGGVKYRLAIPDLTTRYAVARLGLSGPILASASLRPQQVFSAEDTQLQITQTYPDGSRLLEMKIVAPRIYEDAPIRLMMIVGGIVFQDTGDVVKILGPSDFDANGVYTVRFVQSAGSPTATCHTLNIYDGPVYLDRVIGTRD